MVENISKKDNTVNLLNTVKKLFFKSVRKRKLNTSIFSQQFSPEKLSAQSSVGTGSQDKSKGNNVLCFCKTTQWKCKYCKIPTCDFCYIGDTTEYENTRVGRIKNYNSLQ